MTKTNTIEKTGRIESAGSLRVAAETGASRASNRSFGQQNEMAMEADVCPEGFNGPGALQSLHLPDRSLFY